MTKKKLLKGCFAKNAFTLTGIIYEQMDHA